MRTSVKNKEDTLLESRRNPILVLSGITGRNARLLAPRQVDFRTHTCATMGPKARKPGRHEQATDDDRLETEVLSHGRRSESRESGRKMRIMGYCIDTQGHYADEAYSFCAAPFRLAPWSSVPDRSAPWSSAPRGIQSPHAQRARDSGFPVKFFFEEEPEELRFGPPYIDWHLKR